MFFLLTLPFRIFFGVLFGLLLLPFGILLLPFLLLRAVIKLAVFAVVAPILLMVGLLALVATAGALLMAIVIPLLPFALVALFIWAIVRAAQPSYAR